MAYILISLGVLALVAAFALLGADARDKRARATGRAGAEELAPAPGSSAQESGQPGGHAADAKTNETSAAEVAEARGEVEAQEATQEATQGDGLDEDEASVGSTSTGGEMDNAPVMRPHRRSGLQLPGSSRRERRAWAQRHGFEFSKFDEFLDGEWSRGAAAAGATPRDVASGVAYGHETFVADVGEVTVMAMRTGAVSDVVVDLRRRGFDAASSADLVSVGEAEGFCAYATEAGVAQRFLDVRVRTALERFPAAVTAVWCETEWVLAEMDRATAPEMWDDMLAPLALIADAARVLPPHAWHVVEAPYPTRQMAEAIAAEGGVVTLAVPAPKVQRPEEPLQLPTRITGTQRGLVAPHAVGGDEVEPIADGAAREDGPAAGTTTGMGAVTDLTRVRREKTPPSIFDD